MRDERCHKERDHVVSNFENESHADLDVQSPLRTQDKRHYVWVFRFVTPGLIFALFLINREYRYSFSWVYGDKKIFLETILYYSIWAIVLAHLLLAVRFRYFKLPALFVFVVGPLIQSDSLNVNGIFIIPLLLIWAAASYLLSVRGRRSAILTPKRIKRLMVAIFILYIATWIPAISTIRNERKYDGPRVSPILPFLVLSCDQYQPSGECAIYFAYGVGAIRIFGITNWVS